MMRHKSCSRSIFMSSPLCLQLPEPFQPQICKFLRLCSNLIPHVLIHNWKLLVLSSCSTLEHTSANLLNRRHCLLYILIWYTSALRLFSCSTHLTELSSWSHIWIVDRKYSLMRALYSPVPIHTAARVLFNTKNYMTL